ncbi:MAG: sensor histidine kinase [Sphingomonas sp.]|jgi:signal transduction histidine kinase|uniref:sensor histidine kinase n=1 Tax=Sphingomonas sp. TaxID=28214 RepID=UPI0035686DBE
MSADPTLDELKAELGRKVGASTTDFDEILRLADDISRRQEGVVRFATDAALVRRLGRELVAKQETALGELVKNAYDADATGCTVSLVTELSGRGFDIVDDGNGMTYAEITNGFMRLASDQKVVNPVSPKFGRSRAGKKGIGRFATERLGERLTIVTQTEDEQHAWTMEIDWSEFAQGLDIGRIANRISQTPKEQDHGTRLSIRNLRDGWSDGDLRRVYRYLVTLIQPVVEGLEPPADPTIARQYQPDPGFTVEIERSGTLLDEPTTVANVDTEVLGQALAVITAAVDGHGNATWSMSCARFDIEITDEPIRLGRGAMAPLGSARDVDMRAYYFIRRSEFLGHSTSAIGAMLDERGGIRLYRNGYRVPPYGEKLDDWLGLDAKRGTFAPISSKTFVGYVALDDPGGGRFEETSSREGLIESAAFDEVRDLASQVLEIAVRRIESKRGLGRKKREASDPQGGGRAATAIASAVDDLKSAVAHSQARDSDPEESEERIQGAVLRLTAATDAVMEIAQERDELLQEVNLMRILASMGLTIAEFTHDFSHLAETMELNLNALVATAGKQSEAFDKQMERFRGQFRQVRAYTSHFGNMMASNASRELREVDLYAFSRAFEEDLAAMFSKRGLELKVDRPKEYDLRMMPMHESEWSSILLNLLTNSVKAATRAGRGGRFLIQLGRLDGDRVFLDFSDNGDGIPVANREHVFDAFFTTGGGSGARETEAVQAVGTGLGLKIVADIVAAVGGDVVVRDAPDGYTTCIRVTVPAATKGTTEEGAE